MTSSPSSVLVLPTEHPERARRRPQLPWSAPRGVALWSCLMCLASLGCSHPLACISQQSFVLHPPLPARNDAWFKSFAPTGGLQNLLGSICYFLHPCCNFEGLFPTNFVFLRPLNMFVSYAERGYGWCHDEVSLYSVLVFCFVFLFCFLVSLMSVIIGISRLTSFPDRKQWKIWVRSLVTTVIFLS